MTSTEVPFFLPISARASGEVMEMRPFLASASGSPTICHTAFLSVSSSTSVTVAPNLMVSPESLLMSMISARASLSSNSAIRTSLPINCRTHGPAQRSGFGKITLQGADLKVSAQIGADTLRGRHGTRKSGVIWHFMQEGSAPQGAAVGQRLRPFRGVEDQVNVAIRDGVDDMRPALQNLVHFFGGYAAIGQEALRARGGHHLEAKRE